MKEFKWYENVVFYEIYVPSFCDGNGDGIGDLRGVILKLPYLKKLGVGGIWLTPFYPSPKADNGYDISDYRNVDPEYGSLSDFDELLETAHRMGIRVIIDMVLNHTSDRHPWFQESRRQHTDGKYRDYYIWEKEIPNNWESFFDGSAWEYDMQTGMYYYHAFSRQQVCLNWSCEAVVRECLDILAFWLERGVDGFRLDVINFLKTDRSALQKENPVVDGIIQHVYDKNQPGVIDAVRRISKLVHSYPEKYLLGEVGEEDMGLLHPYMGKGLLDSVFQFNLGSMRKLDAAYMGRQVMKMEVAGIYPTLFFSSHDMSRHFNRLCGKELWKAKLLAAFLLTAKGIPFLYQGEELPMEDVVLNGPGDLKDIQGRYGFEKKKKEGKSDEEAFFYALERSRDYSRGMMDWNRINEAGSDSLLHVYQRLLELRNSLASLRTGNYEGIDFSRESLYYQRVGNQEKIGVYLNFGKLNVNVPVQNALLEIQDEDGNLKGLIRYE